MGIKDHVQTGKLLEVFFRPIKYETKKCMLLKVENVDHIMICHKKEISELMVNAQVKKTLKAIDKVADLLTPL